MLRFIIFLIIFATGFQLYAISKDTYFGVSLEAIRQMLFIYLFLIVILTFEKIYLNKYTKKILMLFLLFLIYSLINVFRGPGTFYGMVGVMKLTYLFLSFIIFSQFVNKYDTDYSNEIIRKYVVVSFSAFLAGVITNIARGNIYSPDTGEFLLSGVSGRAIGSFFCSLISIYFYILYLEKKKKTDLLISFLSGLIVLLSFTRIAIAGYIVSFSVVTIAYKKYKFFLLLPLVFLLILISQFRALIVTSLLKETFIDIEDIESFLNRNFLELIASIRLTGREIIWSGVYDAFLKNPIFGNGFGSSNFLTYELTYGTNTEVHNDYLKILSDLGSLGLVLYLAIYLAMFLTALKVYKMYKYKKPYFFMFVASSVQILIFSFTDNIISYAPYHLVYVVIFYLLLVSGQKRQTFRVR